MLRGMAEPPDPLPADPAELVRIIRDLEARNADLQAQVKTLKALILGAKSERTAVIDPDQGVLDLGDLAVEAAPAANDNADRTSHCIARNAPQDLSLPQLTCSPTADSRGSKHEAGKYGDTQ